MSPREIQDLRNRLAAIAEVAKQARDNRDEKIRKGYANQIITELRTLDTDLNSAYHRAFEECS